MTPFQIESGGLVQGGNKSITFFFFLLLGPLTKTMLIELPKNRVV